MPDGALSHFTIIDLTHHVAGPYCTKLLAGFGAEVIKVEKPNAGDGMRNMGPFHEDRKGLERSIPFLWLNTGKKSVELDLKTAEGIDNFKALIAKADVVVENFSPKVMDNLGLGFSELQKLKSDLIMTSISNFGKTGPYRDWTAEEITTYAMSGQMNATGDPGREPLCAGPQINQYTAGLNGYIGTLLALYYRDISGEGQHVDISIHEGAIDHIEIAIINFLHEKVKSRRNKHIMVPWRNYACKDGYATVICAPFRNWLRGAELFKAPELFEKKYEHVRGRHEHREEVEKLIQPWLDIHGKKEIFEAGQNMGLAFGYLASFQEALGLPQHSARNFFVETDHPEVGKYRYCGDPYRLSATPWQQKRAPLLGEHTEDVLSVMTNGSFPEHTGKNKKGRKKKQHSVLQGVRILDLTHSWAGPHATRILADFGAEVIKVEYVHRLGLLRAGIVDDEMYNKRPMWFQVNRGKKSITLDLNNSTDYKTFLDLVRISDVVAENSRGGVLEKHGLNYHGLCRIRPDIIVLSMSAFGKSGPFATYAGYGATMEAMSGVENLTGYNGDEKTCRIREIDVLNGISGAAAVMTALVHKQRTGEGQWIDMSQLETTTHGLIGEHLLQYAMNGGSQKKTGNGHLQWFPCGCYKCKGDDQWVTIVVRSDMEWQFFCEIIGIPRWQYDETVKTVDGRKENSQRIDQAIEKWTMQKTPDEVMQILQQKGLAGGAVRDVESLSRDPHLKERSFFQEAEDSSGKMYPGIPILLSKSPGKIRWRGPDLGEHNASVFEELLGRSKEEIKPIRQDDIGTALDP